GDFDAFADYDYEAIYSRTGCASWKSAMRIAASKKPDNKSETARLQRLALVLFLPFCIFFLDCPFCRGQAMEVWAGPSSPAPELPAVVGAVPSWSDGSAFPVSGYEPANDPCADFFACLEIAGVFPRLHSLLTAPVNVGNQTVQVALGSSALDFTVSPQIRLGAF